ncbi:MAG: hypothetical protein NUV53_01025 [Patescibacteria group bacterium]|nr:hypothetical protein [Patescibacteria group bacterium]
MPLPQKVIDRLSREPSGTPGWSSQLLMFSGTLFIISILVYGGIAIGFKPYFESKQRDLDKKIQVFTQQIPLAEQEKITSFYSQIVNIKSLLDNHVVITPFFKWFEEHTQQNVVYQSLSATIESEKITMSGVAKSIGDVEEQLAVFEKDEVIENVSFGNIAVNDKGGWSFQVSITFTPGFLEGHANN